MKFSKILICVAALAVACCFTQSADAAFKIRVNGGAAGTVQDNQAGDLDLTVGVIVASFSSAEFNVLVSVGQSKPILGANSMTLSLTYTATGVAGTTTIAITDTDFGGNGGAILASAGGNLGAGVSQEWRTTMDTANTEFTVGAGGILVLGPLTGTQGASGGRGGYGTGNPYSMSGAIFLTSAGGNAATGGSSDVSIQNIPEPTTVAIWSLLGGVGLAAGWRKRRNRKVA